MASVKKTMKSSEIKKAKPSGTRSLKAKASQRSAESKARKAAAARAPAAKQQNAKQLNAKKTVQKATVKTITKSKTAAAVTSRAKSPAATPSAKNKKKTAAARASASRNPTVRATKKATAAARRGKPAIARAALSKRAAVSKPARGMVAAAPKKTRVLKVSPSKAAKPAAAARKAVEAKTRAVQKPAASKDTAAALLAFKQNVARLTEVRKRAAAAAPIRPADKTSNLSLESSERMTVIKETGKKIPMNAVSGQADTVAARPPVKDAPAARDASRTGGGKAAGAPLDAKAAAAKLLVSKVPPPIENRPLALAPAEHGASQLNIADAKAADKLAAPAAKPAKTGSPQRPLFKPGEFVVYPAHGVGQILVIEEQEVAGFKLELYVISFIKDKMILKVPTPKAASVGMRKLADATAIKAALDTLAGRARVKRTMWSRRAQEYEAKINSGDLNAIAEVVRDLYRSDTQPEQSYSERQLYEAALDRMAREIVVVQKMTETESLNVIEAQLQKGPRRGKTEDIDAEEAEIEEAA